MPDKVVLVEPTRELMHRYYSQFERDPDLYMDMALFSPYVYDREKVDLSYDHPKNDRAMFLIMRGEEIVGEVGLKKIDSVNGECELTIHMRDDSVKGLGYGTQAEKLMLRYAFEELGMNAVKADSVLKNTRSRHVLEKIGFRFLKEDGIFRYYRIEKEEYERMRS